MDYISIQFLCPAELHTETRVALFFLQQQHQNANYSKDIISNSQHDGCFSQPLQQETHYLSAW